MARSYKDTEEYKTFTDEDKRLAAADASYGEQLAGAKRNFNNAQTDEEREGWRAYAKELSAQKGYARNEDGSKLTKLKEGAGLIDAFNKSIGQGSSYSDQLNKILNSYISDSFSYNPKSDPRYALAKEYAREAMKSQEADAAALSGGYANSYAQEIGQRVYDDYMRNAEANLEADAYARYKDGQNRTLQIYNMVDALENRDYNRKWNEETRGYERRWNEENRDYERRWNEENRDYERRWNEEEREHARGRAIAELLASGGDFSGYRELGLTDEQIAALEANYKARSGGSVKLPLTDAVAALIDAGVNDYNGAYLQALDAGYSVSEAKAIADAVNSSADASQKAADESRKNAWALANYLRTTGKDIVNGGKSLQSVTTEIRSIGKMTAEDFADAIKELSLDEKTVKKLAEMYVLED